jgi:HK97 family phage prohead protease
MSEGKEISGMIAAYNKPTKRNIVYLPGCFRNSLQVKKLDIPFLLFHKEHLIAGKPVELKETEEGLFHTSELFCDSAIGRDAQILINRGILDSFSVGAKFYEDLSCVKDGFYYVEEAELLEYSLVKNPNQPLAVIEGYASKETEDEHAYRDRLKPILYCELETEEIQKYLLREYNSIKDWLINHGPVSYQDLQSLGNQLFDHQRILSNMMTKDTPIGLKNRIGLMDETITTMYILLKRKCIKN